MAKIFSKYIIILSVYIQHTNYLIFKFPTFKTSCICALECQAISGWFYILALDMNPSSVQLLLLPSAYVQVSKCPSVQCPLICPRQWTMWPWISSAKRLFSGIQSEDPTQVPCPPPSFPRTPPNCGHKAAGEVRPTAGQQYPTISSNIQQWQYQTTNGQHKKQQIANCRNKIIIKTSSNVEWSSTKPK